MKHVKKSKISWILVIAVLFVSLFGNVLVPQGTSKVEAADGWTDIPVSADTLTVYVSNSQGNDNNDGLSQSTPVKTLAKAATLVRDGYPDHMLLKRGDVWTDEYLYRFKSGRGATEPMVVSYYGTSGDRPLIKTNTNFIDHNGQFKDYQWFIGLHIKGYKMDPNDPAYDPAANFMTMRFVGGGKNILIEDCKFEFCQVDIQSYPLNDPFNVQPGENIYKDFIFRRNIVVDNYRHGSSTYDAKAQGIYASKTDGLLIEECLFDHNGWNANFTDSQPNMFNHNMYIQYSNIGAKIVIRGNIMARGASHGLQARAGGLIEDNLAVNNSLGILVANNQEPYGLGYTTFGLARNNVALEGRVMFPDTNYPRTPAVNGMEFQLLQECPNSPVTAEGNIAAHRLTSGTNSGLLFGSPEISNINNIQYDWGGGMGDTPNPGWLDPNRSVGSYHGTLGKTPTLDAFLNEARNRGLHEWPSAYTAYAVNAYIQAGFTVTGPTPTPTPSPTPTPAPNGYKYDMGTSTSAVMAGYARVTETTAYTAGNYGWTNTSGLYSKDRSSGTNLTKDLIQCTAPKTFKVDLPNGSYTVNVIMGDANYAHDNMVVKADGVTKASGITTAAGQWYTAAFPVTVSGGSLSLEFSDGGGTDTNWVVNGIEIVNQTPPISCKYDLGTSTSALMAGYTRVTETTSYTAGNFGWTNTAGLYSKERGSGTDLTKDLIQCTAPKTFKVDLPNGSYTVTVILGDAYYAHDSMVVKAEGVTKASGITTAAGQWYTATFPVTVSGGSLSLEFSDGGGTDTNWVVNAIEIVG